MQIAVERGRETRPDIKLGICGEHGGDPASIAFCEEIGLDYVSCSPFRVPIARLAAAQASLRAAGPAGRAGNGVAARFRASAIPPRDGDALVRIGINSVARLIAHH